MHTPRNAAWFVPAVLLASCSKPAPPLPDGSSGVQGTCLLAAEPAEKDGVVPTRPQWAGVILNVREANSPDGTSPHTFSTTTDMTGRFHLPLNPGDYTVELHDRVRLMGKTHTPMSVRVEPGSFTDLVVEYDKLDVRYLPGR